MVDEIQTAGSIVALKVGGLSFGVRLAGEDEYGGVWGQGSSCKKRGESVQVRTIGITNPGTGLTSGSSEPNL